MSIRPVHTVLRTNSSYKTQQTLNRCVKNEVQSLFSPHLRGEGSMSSLCVCLIPSYLHAVMPSHPAYHQRQRTPFPTSQCNEACLFTDREMNAFIQGRPFTSRSTEEQGEREVSWPAGRKRNDWPRRLRVILQSVLAVTHMHVMAFRSPSLTTFRPIQEWKRLLCNLRVVSVNAVLGVGTRETGDSVHGATDSFCRYRTFLHTSLFLVWLSTGVAEVWVMKHEGCTRKHKITD